ncbi:MAG: hypothetical protein ACI8XO_003565 [Verrucomicrobiales bacterium]
MDRKTTIFVSLGVAFGLFVPIVRFANQLYFDPLQAILRSVAPVAYSNRVLPHISAVESAISACAFAGSVALVALCVGGATLFRHRFFARADYGKDYLRAWAIVLSAAPMLLGVWVLCVHFFFQSSSSGGLVGSDALEGLGIKTALSILGGLILILGIVSGKLERDSGFQACD